MEELENTSEQVAEAEVPAPMNRAERRAQKKGGAVDKPAGAQRFSGQGNVGPHATSANNPSMKRGSIPRKSGKG